ncbi:glycosyl hydrolase [Hyphomicrobium sp. 99]|uniref:glycoside hydrolase family 19 protein n=1 Tax=Hyphomicrobium sp. 99 TaxID=1163419 RepID=UPI0012DFFBA9|nr:glycosyl hydrolase [Hyphomicrobium sp. 99]
MTIRLDLPSMRALFPKAPEAVLKDFIDKQDSILGPAGINHTRNRLKFFFANIEHEVDGFTIKNLTENINYTAARMAAVWPNRFENADAVRAKYGTKSGWQKRAFDDIYGNRMGNRPGSDDGSRFIGRGGPQITGRDGYAKVGALAKLPLEDKPEIAAKYDNQAAVSAAFWTWKKMNAKADTGDFIGCVRLWNGGTNGLADRRARMAGNEAIINRLPGSPPTSTPGKDVIDAATEKERRAIAAGGGGCVVGGAAEGVKQTGVASESSLPKFVTYPLIATGVCIVLVAAVLIIKKRKDIFKNWY